MLKVAVIGAGYMGSLHARVYSQRDDVQLVAVVDHSLERASRIGHGASSYQDVESLLRHHRPDAVSVAVTSDQLATTAAFLLENGIPTLIEKPMALSRADGEKLVDIALRRNVVAAVGYSECFNPAAEVMRRLIAGNALEQIYEFHAIRRSPVSNRTLKTNVIYDLLGHDVSLLYFLFPDDPITRLESVSAFVRAGTLEGYCGVCKLESGIIGSLNTNRYSPDKIRQWTVMGAEGTLRCDLLYHHVELQRIGKPTEAIPVNDSDSLVNEIDDFISAIRNGHSPLIPAALGAELLGILDAAAGLQPKRS